MCILYVVTLRGRCVRNDYLKKVRLKISILVIIFWSNLLVIVFNNCKISRLSQAKHEVEFN